MNTRDAIDRAAPVLAQYGQSIVTVPWLVRGGLSRAQAEHAIRFVPLAFGREVLTGIGVQWSDTYVCVIEGAGVSEERPLADEEFFREAAALASAIAANLGIDVFNAIAMQSSEFAALNSALNAGANPENLVASPPVITWPDAATSRIAEKKKWWKWWG